MSKERQHEVTESDDRKARVNERVRELDNAYQKLEKERKVEESKQTFEKRKQELASRAADMIERHGKDYFLSQTMLTFLEVAIQMEEAISMLNDVNVAMSCITDAISCMDNILEVNSLALDSTMARKHGFFQRLKTKRRIRATIRNNNGRMREISSVLSGNQKIAFSIVNALQKSNREMQTFMSKSMAKQKKLEAKKAPTTASAPTSAEIMVDGILNARGGSDGAGKPAGGAGAAPSPTQGGAVGGSSDIADIL